MVCEINLALLEKLLKATPHGALQEKLLALREQAYVTEFVDPQLLVAYDTARMNYANHSRATRPATVDGGATLH